MIIGSLGSVLAILQFRMESRVLGVIAVTLAVLFFIGAILNIHTWMVTHRKARAN
jgi:uncharacterized membrane protein